MQDVVPHHASIFRRRIYCLYYRYLRYIATNARGGGLVLRVKLLLGPEALLLATNRELTPAYINV